MATSNASGAEQETDTGDEENKDRGGARRRWIDSVRLIRICKQGLTETSLRSVHTDAREPIQTDGGELTKLTGDGAEQGSSLETPGGGGARRGGGKWELGFPERPWACLNRSWGLW